MLLRTNKLVLAMSLGLASTLTHSAATSPTIEEVTVTAQKREQNLQSTPISVSAFDATDIENKKVNDIADVSASIPNVQIAPSPGGATGATIAIRGASMINPAVTWEPAVGMYFDGVFLSKNTGGLFDVVDIERIEVLRGPQGTLYGKNTTGGAINIITRQPGEAFGGKVKVGTGNYGYTEATVSVDSGRVMNDIARFNIAYSKRDRDGFYDNLSELSSIDEFKKLDAEAGRIASVFDLSDAVEFSYAYDWAKRDNTVAMGQVEVPDFAVSLTAPPAPKPERQDSANLDGAANERSKNSGHALDVTWDVSDSLTIKSITSYREMTFDDGNDYDGFPVYVQPATPTDPGTFHTERHIEQDQTSQEFQFIGEQDSFNYVAGLYYFKDKADVANPYIVGLPASVFGPLPAPFTADNFYGVETESVAAYGQLDYMINDQFTLTAGGRYTREQKDAYVEKPLSYTANGSDEWTNFSPTLIASYAFTDATMAYVKVARGWKSGGFNAEAATQTEAETAYDEETLTSYELGLKTIWMERLRTNMAVFLNKVKDLQVSAWDAANNASKVDNAGEATISGFELESLIAITEELEATFNYGYLDTQYDDFIDPVSQAQLKDSSHFAYAPRQSYSFGLSYVHAMNFAELRAQIDYAFVDDQYFYYDAYSAAVTKSDSYALVNARVALAEIAAGENNTLEVGVWGKNLTDEEYRLNGIPTASGAALNYYGDPRTYGADLTFRF